MDIQFVRSPCRSSAVSLRLPAPFSRAPFPIVERTASRVAFRHAIALCSVSLPHQFNNKETQT